MSKLERLQQDSSNLQTFVDTLAQKGNDSLAKKIIAKKRFLDDKIEELFPYAVN